MVHGGILLFQGGIGRAFIIPVYLEMHRPDFADQFAEALFEHHAELFVNHDAVAFAAIGGAVAAADFHPILHHVFRADAHRAVM